jgi:hypothetical protein
MSIIETVLTAESKQRGYSHVVVVNGCQETLFSGCEDAVSSLGGVLSGVPGMGMRSGGVARSVG